jgi:transcriptional regulator with XRE-family HTH domain
MLIGDRLRTLPEEKELSQGDIEKRTGLLRCYISRVENGHTMPTVETLEKTARARSPNVPAVIRGKVGTPGKLQTSTSEETPDGEKA